jgi:hypothetical protein
VRIAVQQGQVILASHRGNPNIVPRDWHVAWPTPREWPRKGPRSISWARAPRPRAASRSAAGYSSGRELGAPTCSSPKVMSGKNNSPSLPRAPAGNGSYPLRHFLRHFFGSFVIRRAPSSADGARCNPLVQSTLSGAEGRFTEQDGTPAEVTLDYLVMVRIHARQVPEPEYITNVFTFQLKIVVCHF